MYVDRERLRKARVERARSVLRDMELKSRMIICLEPGVTEPEKPYIGVEDMILVTDTGFEILTKMEY